MAYETGISSSPSDLVSKLCTFAAANGWTANTPASGRVLVRDSVVVGLSSDSDEVLLRGALAYSAGDAWDAQTNNAGVTLRINTGTGPFTAYHFFLGAEDGADYIHVALEISAGIYRHFSLGELVKSGSFTGGTYVDGTVWSLVPNNANQSNSSTHQAMCDANNQSLWTGHIWVDYDSKVNNWQVLAWAGSVVTTHCSGSCRSFGMEQHMVSQGVMSWNLRNLLAPLYYYANRASSLRSRIGRIPHARALGLHNLLPGETITIGSDDWMVFPVTQRHESTPASSVQSSLLQGYAYRVIP